MTAMEFCPSDFDHMPSNFLDMIENDVQSHLMDVDNLHSEKSNDMIFSPGLEQGGMQTSHLQVDYEQENWFQNLQWSDISKIPQSLLDASNEVENNNPNLLVNPQTGLPVPPNQQKNGQLNQLTLRNGLLSGSVKLLNTQGAVLNTSHQQMYVAVPAIGNNNLNSICAPVGYTVQPVTVCTPVQTVRNTSTVTPSQNSPVLVEHLQNGVHQHHVVKPTTKPLKNNNNTNKNERVYPKPAYSYSCLIAMALKNSRNGSLPVSEIYNFMIENFPYFKTAPDGWKNSVRHNLSLNKCFEKVESPKSVGSHTRKGCLWGLNPAKIEKMEEEIVKWRKKDPESVKNSMARPENLELIEQGRAGQVKEESKPVIPESIAPPVIPTSTATTATAGKNITIKTEPNMVIVKVDPDQDQEVDVEDLKDIDMMDSGLSLDPSLSDLALQNGLWDDDLNSELGLTTNQSHIALGGSINGTLSLSMPSTHVNGSSLYHGHLTYSTGTQGIHSPHGTPTKIYPSTPSRVLSAVN
ncbi:hypothetical protein ACJMK2_020926 [Sinanodonta woodiana]|uniref:Fork-head domain-containing protein n=1 Tax=Sinanodonta woodiana TaxID=1069815 RepID=A0ABD3U2A5_SINWO